MSTDAPVPGENPLLEIVAVISQLGFQTIKCLIGA